MGKTWSLFQQAVIDEARDGMGHAVVVARAGSGKTTTIMGAVEAISGGKDILLCAFNKSIQMELAERAPGSVDVKTLHSLGLQAVKSAWGKGVRIDDKRTEIFCKKLLPRDFDGMIAVRKLVGFGKNLWAKSVEDVYKISIAFDVSADNIEQYDLAGMAWEVMEMGRQSNGTVDFDDMIWLPCVEGMQLPGWDVVFVDETQDLNACQLELVKKAAKGKGRIIAVGDDRQAIYQFRGADSEAMPRMIKELQATVLPLSVTYRCGRVIVKQAQQIVPDLQAWEGAEDGVMFTCSYEKMIRECRPGDFILSRTNAPMMSLCLGFLRRGIRACIQGRDVGKSIMSLVRKAKVDDVPGMIEWLMSYREKQMAIINASGGDERAVDALYDKIDTIVALCDGLSTITELDGRISQLFSDDKESSGAIMLSSVHKAKGLEADKVWMLADTFRGGKTEEDNIKYVAITRAKKQLAYVYKDDDHDEE